jgi:uncharacterized protein YecE (DUF72 family)
LEPHAFPDIFLHGESLKRSCRFMAVRVGCCGFRRARSKYYHDFAVVEIQKTFYKPPRIDTVRHWRREAPPDFVFTLKAWQLITHEPSSPTYGKAGIQVDPNQRNEYGRFRPTSQVWEAWKKTESIAHAVGAVVVLFQCPASFTPIDENIANLRAFFSAMGKKRFHCAWEPRGPWPEKTIRELCRELGLIHCVDPLASSQLWGEVGYYRLHGHGGYGYRYTDGDLKRLRESISSSRGGYLFFNNISMYEDALRFKRLLRQK